MTNIGPLTFVITHGDEITGGRFSIKLEPGKSEDIEKALSKISRYIRTLKKCKIEILEQ